MSARWIATALAALMWAAPAAAQRFEFVAFGDMPYYMPDDYPRVERLIDRINARNPAFSIHVGDTKSGGSPCSDDNIMKSKALFDRVAGAVFYTPGDNEWTDCHRLPAGGFDPVERLDFLRRTHFQKPESLGQKPLAATRQADTDPRYAKYVENLRWSHNGVQFATLHIVGSNNNFERRAGAPEEFTARNAANTAWIDAVFAEAKKNNAIGVVFAFQADMWAERPMRDDLSSGFSDSIAALSRNAAAFGKPVLLINGDSHELVVDQPLKDERKRLIATATRLMVMGAAQVHAVTIGVDPNSPGLFSFAPLIVPEHLVAR